MGSWHSETGFGEVQMKTATEERAMLEESRDLCRARQIACVVLARSNAEHSKEFAEKAFDIYRDAADALSKVLDIVS